jgi:cobalt-zinc-cadmium efflux system membrane fusion protein
MSDIASLEEPSDVSPRPRSRRWIAMGVGVSVAVLLALGLRVLTRSEHAVPPSAYQVENDLVSLAPGAHQPVRFGTAAATLDAPLPVPPLTARVATVQTLTAPSFAPLPGRVVDVRVRMGDRVEQGTKLALVRTAELPALQHDLHAAELSVRTKQAMVDRTRMLVESRAASQNELLMAQSELQQARLEAQAADAKLHSLSVEQSGDNAYWLLASRPGTVVQLDAEPGMQVGPDRSDPIATIADLDEVVVVGDLPQRDAAGVRSGLPATVRLPGSAGASVVGRIESVSEVVDPDRQTVPIRVRMPNRERLLRPNAYVELEIAPQADAPLVQVPANAVVSDGADAVVFVEEKPGTFRRRAVQLGRQTPERVEITSGLASGEHVVVDGALLLLNALDVER